MHESEDDLLSTGDAAAILGTTVQHVVNLCNRGDLPYTLTGTHRRIRRGDVLALRDRRAANRGGPLTDDQLRNLWMHRAASGRVALDPLGAISRARSTIERRLERNPDGARWLRQWLAIMDQGPEAVMRTMTSTDPIARELRQNSPFIDLLSDKDRRDILAAFDHLRRTEGLSR